MVAEVQTLLDLREIDGQLHSQIHGVCEVMEEDGTDPDERREVLSGWVGRVRVLLFLL